jgi:tight adherence protein C
MKLFTSKSYWINRLYSNKDEISILKDEIYYSANVFINNTLLRWFDNRFFCHSLLIKDIKLKLSIAGIDEKVYSFWKGLLLTTGLVNGCIIFALTAKDVMSPLILLLPFFALVGYILPEFYVIDKLQQIEYEVHTDFPRFLDLLYIYTSTAAYEHIGNAIFSISEHMNGALSRQLREITIIYRFVDVNEFLDHFEKRFQTPLAKDLVSTLRLADEYGGNISEKIGILAEEAHKERMQNARQKGQKASAMLMVPLMLFHFPVAVIIFLAPTAIALKQVFGW